jgi:hypothetical protein
VAAFDAFMRAQALTDAGEPAQAVPLLEEITRANPANHLAQFMLGLDLVALGRDDEAVTPFEQALAHRPGPFMNGHLELARCLERLGRTDDALRQYALAFARLAPGEAAPADDVRRAIRLLEAAGRTDEARAFGRLLPR